METIQNFPEITKKDFPLLNKNLKSSEQIIYLDHAATTQKPIQVLEKINEYYSCLLYTSPSPRDRLKSRMPSSA